MKTTLRKSIFLLGAAFTFTQSADASAFTEGSINGQDGWVNRDPGNIVEQISEAAALTGSQGWHLQNDGDSTSVVQITSPVLAGGAGESNAVGNPAANAISMEIYLRTADTSFETGSDDIVFRISFGALASKRNTYFGIRTTEAGLVPFESDAIDTEGVLSFSTIWGDPLQWGEWYRLSVDAIFVDGTENDIVHYQLFNSSNTLVYDQEVGSWEEAYYLGSFEPNQAGHIMTSNMITFEVGGLGNGFYFDDLSARTFNTSAPETTIAEYATDFEAVPEPAACTFILLGAGTLLVTRRRRA